MAIKGVQQLRDDDFLKEIGEKIKKYRKEKGMSQRQLAEACHEDRDFSQIARMEKGAVNFSVSYLSLVAKALNISPKDLLPD